VALSNVTQVEPGSQVTFGFSGQLLSITPQENTNTYRLEYEAGDGGTHSVWLGTASSLALKLNWARRYHLGGVAVADVLAAGNAAGIVDAVVGYRNGAAPPAGQKMDIVWTISNAEAGVGQQVSPLTEPDYVWTVAVATGTYTVSATIAGFEHGAVPVSVGAPEPEVAEVVTTTGDLDVSEPAVAASELTDECFDARYVADVTIPDNTQFDNDEAFVKTWRVRNAGTCDWPEDTVLAFSDGSQMGASASVAVGALESGADIEVSVDMTAPSDAGRYTGSWRMQTADGFFGGNLTVVIQAGEVTAPPAPIGPINSGSFELGGHVRDTGFPYADKMHYAGMNWTKVQVHYGQDVSGLVAASHAQGFKIQLSALGSPDMVTKSGFEQDFANWVAGMAAAGADAIEVWNEPNIDREWAIGHISPQAYTNLLCASYNAIKAANPGAAVISAAPAPTGWFGGCGPNGCDDAPWMAGMRDAGAANCMDYIGAHHNSGATSPSARIGHPANPGDTHHSWFFLPQTEMYYNTFGGARKLFYTEMGYASQEGLSTFSDQFAWARGTNNAQQAAWLAEAVQLSVNTGMVRCIIVWNIDFVRYGYDPQDGYAIIRPGGGCPACDSLHNVLGAR
ncbi:MAG: NBR1-Ig-like domain-containing protein, partial [Chloroflexota bacterium]|nr:NBR1-Ig-like domain-containing protein [Chloroflexota bacterium]